MKKSSDKDERLFQGSRLAEGELCPERFLKDQQAAFERDIARMHLRSSEFVSLPCIACESLVSAPIFAKYGFQFLCCNDCGTIYMSPRPSESVMADYYASSENYAYWAEHIFPASEAVRSEKIHKPWLDRIVEICRKYGSEGERRLIEVGPGFGTFAALATRSSYFDDVVAVEPTPEMAAACRERGVKVIEKRVEEVDVEVESASVLVAFEVIEHLFLPRNFIEQARRLIRPGGLLILTCPNGEGFDIAELGPLSQAVDAEHVNLFNPRSLSRLLSDVGFDVLELLTPGRLDAEIVREAVLAGYHDISSSAFLQKVLVDEWDSLGWSFQQFLAESGLSSHMWVVARRKETGDA